MFFFLFFLKSVLTVEMYFLVGFSLVIKCNFVCSRQFVLCELFFF